MAFWNDFKPRNTIIDEGIGLKAAYKKKRRRGRIKAAYKKKKKRKKRKENCALLSQT